MTPPRQTRSTDEHHAKLELLRLNDILSHDVLLIGGLAVQRYHLARSSKDIDIVCSVEEQKHILTVAYPSTEYEHSERSNDLRPSITITHRKNGIKIYIGPKILEREPYEYLDYSELFEDSIPFNYDDKVAERIRVPPTHALAYSKLLAFIKRHKSEKGRTDLNDFMNLTNHKSFSIARLIDLIERAGASTHIRDFFLNHKFSNEELSILRDSSIVRLQSIIPIAAEIREQTNIIRSGNLSAQDLVQSIDTVAHSPFGIELGPVFDAIKDLQFSGGRIRRNWEIQISYDLAELEAGFIYEIIEWEYELINITPEIIAHEAVLIHSKDGYGKVVRIYSQEPDGTRKEIEFKDTRTYLSHHWRQDSGTISLKPGVPYFFTLYYRQKWPVNKLEPFINNSLTSKDPCIGCRIRFRVPDGFRVSLIKRFIIEPHMIGNVYDVRFAEPLLAEQKIEYVLERNRNDVGEPV